MPVALGREVEEERDGARPDNDGMRVLCPPAHSCVEGGAGTESTRAILRRMASRDYGLRGWHRQSLGFRLVELVEVRDDMAEVEVQHIGERVLRTPVQDAEVLAADLFVGEADGVDAGDDTTAVALEESRAGVTRGKGEDGGAQFGWEVEEAEGNVFVGWVFGDARSSPHALCRTC